MIGPAHLSNAIDRARRKNKHMEEEIRELMENYDLDEDKAEEVQGVIDELGVDEEDAIMLVEEGL